MIGPQINCDVCQKSKGAANHWWLMVIVNGHSQKGLAVYPWRNDQALKEGTLHLCGATCVHKKVSEFLGETSSEERKQAIAS